MHDIVNHALSETSKIFLPFRDDDAESPTNSRKLRFPIIVSPSDE